ncbi:MAG: hypothetical protein GWN56_09395 [Nitrosopumilaceae archaeon]|nr:hypothetical protein [Nitrosopumilaceae archaeon]
MICYKKRENFEPKTREIQGNVKASTTTYQKFHDVFTDPQKLRQFCNFNTQTFGIPEIDTRRLLSNFFIFHSLNYIESHKLFLNEIIRKGVKIGKRKTKIKLDTPLGTTVVSLSQELKFPDFEKLFPKQFRNIIGHSAWYWKNKKLIFEDEYGNKKKLTYNEFLGMMTEFNRNMNEIVREYLSRLKSMTRS